MKKAEKDLSREIELKAEVITELRYELEHGTQRISDYSPAAATPRTW